MCVYIRVEPERSFVGERCRPGPRCCVAWYSSEPEHILAPQTAAPTLHHPHPQLPHHRCLLTRWMPMAVHCLPGVGPPLQGTISLCTRQNRSLTRSNAAVCVADVYTINYKYYFIKIISWEPNQWNTTGDVKQNVWPALFQILNVDGDQGLTSFKKAP